MKQGLQSWPTECLCPVKRLVVKWMDNVLEASEMFHLTNACCSTRQKPGTPSTSAAFSKSRWPAEHTFFLTFLGTASSGSAAQIPTAVIHTVKGWVNDFQIQPPPCSTHHTPVQPPIMLHFHQQICFDMFVSQKPYSFVINMIPLNKILHTHFSIVFRTP